MFVAEPGSGGIGVVVEKGDTFHIPAGSIEISLDPAISTGQLTRAGVSWFASELLSGSLPVTDEELADYLERVRKEADDFLANSALLSDFNLKEEAEVDAAIELLKDKRDTTEWWMPIMGSAAAWLLEDVPPEQRPDVIRHAVRMQAARSVVAYKQSLEPHVWAGYRHNSLVYGIAAAAAQDPDDTAKIKAVQPLFERQGEEVLHAWVHSGVEIGSRLGVRGIEEPLLQALAHFHLGQFERGRSDERFEREYRTKVWTNRVAGAAVGAAIASAVAGFIAARI